MRRSTSRSRSAAPRATRCNDRCRCRPPGCCETGPATTPRPRAFRLRGSGSRANRACSSPLLFGCFLSGLTLTGKGDYDEAFAAFTEGLVARGARRRRSHPSSTAQLPGLVVRRSRRPRSCRGAQRHECHDRPPAWGPGHAAERGAQSRRDLPGQRRSGARAGPVRQRLPVLEESVYQPVDALPVFHSDVRRPGRVWRSREAISRPRGRTAPSASSWPLAPGPGRIW